MSLFLGIEERGFMDKELFIFGTIWFLVCVLFFVGILWVASYNAEHYQNCWDCGARIDKQSVYCTHCGADMTPVCDNCGAECYTPYCGSCGTKADFGG